MTTIAFLASSVDPRIAAAAAQAALGEPFFASFLPAIGDSCFLSLFTDKYCKLKEEVPPWLTDTHQKTVGEAFDAAKCGEGEMPDERYGLSAMNIAGLADGQWLAFPSFNSLHLLSFFHHFF